ncbi:hypothetical protein GOFOIKOB_1103 [Methylobacterium tardum]|nr:hypothetical protein GOFOIKOB_1103 [Methylobacterium tardum]
MLPESVPTSTFLSFQIDSVLLIVTADEDKMRIVADCNFSNAALICPLTTVWLASRHAWLAGIVGVEYESESK